jgi:hypothetical protein
MLDRRTTLVVTVSHPPSLSLQADSGAMLDIEHVWCGGNRRTTHVVTVSSPAIPDGRQLRTVFRSPSFS